jgi:hypothetical protein
VRGGNTDVRWSPIASCLHRDDSDDALDARQLLAARADGVGDKVEVRARRLHVGEQLLERRACSAGRAPTASVHMQLPSQRHRGSNSSSSTTTSCVRSAEHAPFGAALIAREQKGRMDATGMSSFGSTCGGGRSHGVRADDAVSSQAEGLSGTGSMAEGRAWV